MIEVFVTDIETPRRARAAINRIREVFPNYMVTVDLEDREKIMRVDSQNGPVKAEVVQGILLSLDHHCALLDH